MKAKQEFNGAVTNAAAGDIRIENHYQSGTPTAMRLQEKILFKKVFGIDCSDAAAVELMKLQAVSFGPRELRLAWDTDCLRYCEHKGLITETSWFKGMYGVFMVLLAVALQLILMLKFEVTEAKELSKILGAISLTVFFSWMIYAAIRQYILPQAIAIRVRRTLEPRS